MASPRRPAEAIVINGNDREITVEHVQGEWLVWARFTLADGAPRIAELRIRDADEASPVAGGVTTDTLRAVRTGPLFDALGKHDGSGARFAMTLHGLDPDQNYLANRHPGRRGRDDAIYAQWAARYAAKCKTTRAPYPELAKEYPGFSARTIRELILKARRRDLLTGGGQGNTGGELTPKAKRLLNEMKGQA